MKTRLFLIGIIILSVTSAIQGQIITTIAGTGVSGYSGDGGPAISAKINFPSGITIGPKGDIYFCDPYVVRKINTSGIITRFAGNGNPGFSGDGGPATDAQLNAPWDIASDQYGNIFIAEFHGPVIRKVDTFGIITTVAGIGMSGGFSGDNGPATDARMGHPTGVAVDKNGNIFISDYGFGNYRIRKVNTAGIITTICGTGINGFSGDGGPATLAQIDYPCGITTDKLGNVYFADRVNNRIRKIDTGGIITTIAGNGTIGFNGDGIPATNAFMQEPWGVTIDSMGNLYFVDHDGNRCRKVSTTGIISTVAGNGSAGFSGDGGNPLYAELFLPKAMAIDHQNNICITDASNHRIRMIRYNVGINKLESNRSRIIISPNPTSGIFSLDVLTDIPDEYDLTITDILGNEMYKSRDKTNTVVNVNLNVPEGVYFAHIHTSKNYFYRQIIIMH